MIYKFFDQNGNLLETYLNNGRATLNLIFDTVSVDLFASLQLYMFEEVYAKTNHQMEDDNSFLQQETTLIRVLNLLAQDRQAAVYTFLSDINWKIFGIQDNTNLNLNLDRLDSFSEYITRTYDLEKMEWRFEINDNGIAYLNQIGIRNEEQELRRLGYTRKLVTPRDAFVSEEPFNQRTRLFFMWERDNPTIKNDEIFLYDIEEDFIEVHKSSYIQTEPEMYPQLRRFSTVELDPNLTPDGWLELSDRYLFSNKGAENDLFTDDVNSFILPRTLFSPVSRVVNDPNNLDSKPFTINFGLNSNMDDYYNRTLSIYMCRTRPRQATDANGEYIYDEKGCPVWVRNVPPENILTHIVDIYFEGEVVAEEERFYKLLENFGRSIDREDFYIMLDYEEDKPDFIRINEKRKELLLEGDQIFPFMGSYKALFNALKWLEFQDVTIREYFYNIQTWREDEFIEYQKYDFDTSTETNWRHLDGDGEVKNPFKNYSQYVFNSVTLDSANYNKDWKKTSRLGLIWAYNGVTGDYDSWGYPIIRNKNEYNLEEVMLKLYGLKKLLYKYFLPHNVRIINITAEGVYFVKFQLVNWNNIATIIRDRLIPNFNIRVVPTEMKLVNIYELLKNVFDIDYVGAKICDMQNVSLCDEDMKFRNVASFRDIKHDYLLKYPELTQFLIDNFENVSEVLDFIKHFWSCCQHHSLDSRESCKSKLEKDGITCERDVCESTCPYHQNELWLNFEQRDLANIALFLLVCDEVELTWEDFTTISWEMLEVTQWSCSCCNCESIHQRCNCGNDCVNGKCPHYFNNFHSDKSKEINRYNWNRGIDCKHNFNECVRNNPRCRGYHVWDYCDRCKNCGPCNEEDCVGYPSCEGCENRPRCNYCDDCDCDKNCTECDQFGICGYMNGGYPKIKWTWETHWLHEKQRIKWMIKHSKKPETIRRIEGLFENRKKVLYPAIFWGKYDVYCDVYNDDNKVSTVREDDFFEVVLPDPEIYAFENVNEKIDNIYEPFPENIDEEDLSDRVSPLTPVPIPQNLNWTDLEYYNYLKQDFIIPYIHSLQIIDIDLHNNLIKVKSGFDLIEYANKYRKNWDNMYLFKSWLHNLKPEDDDFPNTIFKVTHIDNNNVALIDFNPELLPKTLINWYGYCIVFEKYHNTNMRLNFENKTIVLNVEDEIIRNKFIVGESVWLFEMNKKIKKEFLIIGSHINHDTKDVTLTLRDDGSIFFGNGRAIPESNLDYNYMRWTELELRHNRMSMKVRNLHYEDNILVMDTDINRRYVDDVEERIDDLWLDFNVENSLLTYSKDTEIVKVDDEIYEIELPSNVICRLSNDYYLTLAPFDWVNAHKKTQLEHLRWWSF